MKLAQALLRWFTSFLLHATILLVVLSLCFVFLFGNKQVAKDVLRESGVYNQFVQAILDDNKKASDGKVGILPIDDPKIEDIAKEAFSPGTLQVKSEYFIDQLYAWLDGSAEKLEFTIDLNEQKEVFIENVSVYAATRLSSLPNCTNENISEVTVFELTCRPENVSMSFVKERVYEDLSATEFLQDVSLTQDDLPKTEDGKSIHERLSFVPQINQIAKNSIWVVSALFIIVAGSFVYVRKPFRKGFKALGRDLFSNGFTFIIMTVIFGFVLPTFTNTLNVQGSNTVTLLNKLTDVAVRRFDVLIINIALQLVAVAVLILAIERISRPTSLYSNASRKSGVISSQAKKSSSKSEFIRKSPPLQTSEVPKKRKVRKTIPRRYKGSGF